MFVKDIRWNHPSNSIVCGPSSSGKTSILDKIVRRSDKLFKGSSDKKIILFYNSDQRIYNRWQEDGLIAHKQKGVPSLSSFLELVNIYCEKQGCIAIFDDLGSDIKSNIAFFRELFQIHSHHSNISVFLVLHNLFTPGIRDLSLNCHRFVLTFNPRDSLSISTLARQCFPHTKGFLPSVYKTIGETKFGYLVLDFCQNTPQDLRVTSNWFEETPHGIMVYQPTEKKDEPYKLLHLITDSYYKVLIDAKNKAKESYEIFSSKPNSSNSEASSVPRNNFKQSPSNPESRQWGDPNIINSVSHPNNAPTPVQVSQNANVYQVSQSAPDIGLNAQHVLTTNPSPPALNSQMHSSAPAPQFALENRTDIKQLETVPNKSISKSRGRLIDNIKKRVKNKKEKTTQLVPLADDNVLMDVTTPAVGQNISQLPLPAPAPGQSNHSLEYNPLIQPQQSIEYSNNQPSVQPIQFSSLPALQHQDVPTLQFSTPASIQHLPPEQSNYDGHNTLIQHESNFPPSQSSIQYSTTPAIQHNTVSAIQHESSPPAIEHSAPRPILHEPKLQYSAAPAIQHNTVPAIHHESAPPAIQHSAPRAILHEPKLQISSPARVQPIEFSAPKAILHKPKLQISSSRKKKGVNEASPMEIDSRALVPTDMDIDVSRTSLQNARGLKQKQSNKTSRFNPIKVHTRTIDKLRNMVEERKKKQVRINPVPEITYTQEIDRRVPAQQMIKALSEDMNDNSKKQSGSQPPAKTTKSKSIDKSSIIKPAKLSSPSTQNKQLSLSTSKAAPAKLQTSSSQNNKNSSVTPKAASKKIEVKVKDPDSEIEVKSEDKSKSRKRPNPKNVVSKIERKSLRYNKGEKRENTSNDTPVKKQKDKDLPTSFTMWRMRKTFE